MGGNKNYPNRHTRKVGLLGIVNKASGTEGTQNRGSRTHMSQAPQSFPPDLVARLVECPSGAKAAWFFPSDAALLQSWGKPGAPFAIKAEGRKLEVNSRWG